MNFSSMQIVIGSWGVWGNKFYNLLILSPYELVIKGKNKQGKSLQID